MRLYYGSCLVCRVHLSSGELSTVLVLRYSNCYLLRSNSCANLGLFKCVNVLLRTSYVFPWPVRGLTIRRELSGMFCVLRFRSVVLEYTGTRVRVRVLTWAGQHAVRFVLSCTDSHR